MIRNVFVLLVALGLAGCGRPPANPQARMNYDPSLKPTVPIITPYGNTISCTAGPGAVCVQR
jgi:hypothetical protein